MTLKEQAHKSGLFLSEERVEWNENDWPSLEGLEGGFRAFHASVVLDHTVVVMGGVKQEGATNSVLILNLAERNKQWRVGPPMNKSRNGLAAVGCNGGIYVMGGYNGNTLDCIEQINASDLLQQSSTSSSTHESHWTTLNCRLSIRRNGCCAVVVHNRYLVVMGGWDGEQSLSSVDILDTSNQTVIAGPNMTVPRLFCASAVVDHRIFVVGGSTVEYLDFGTPSDNEKRNNTLSTFISSLSSWTTHSDLVFSAPRGSCTMTTMGSCLVVAGGSHQTVEVWDTHRNRTWNLPPFENRHENCSMVTVANQVAVIGGVVNPSCATLPLMDKNTWCFQRLCEQHPNGCFHSLEGMGTRDADSNCFSTST